MAGNRQHGHDDNDDCNHGDDSHTDNGTADAKDAHGASAATASRSPLDKPTWMGAWAAPGGTCAGEQHTHRWGLVMDPDADDEVYTTAEWMGVEVPFKVILIMLNLQVSVMQSMQFACND